MVLLLSYKDCNGENMWYDIQRMNVAAVGPDKRCLLETNEEGLGRDFVNSAKEHELGIHAWTERLETEFVDTDRFATAEEELRYLFYDLEIEGIFAENVDIAVRVSNVECLKDEGGDGVVLPTSSSSGRICLAGDAICADRPEPDGTPSIDYTA